MSLYTASLWTAGSIEFGFWLDSAASDKNALCAHWLTEADDALNSEWISHGAIWNICIIVCLSWAVNHYRDNAIAYKEQRDKKVSELKQATATITDMQQRQRAADVLDAKYTKELADAKAENDALRRKLDNGGRVLVKGKCPVPSSAETSGASGMGNDATVELSPVAGRNVLGIRDGIISDQTALRTLQEYIRTQCLR